MDAEPVILRRRPKAGREASNASNVWSEGKSGLPLLRTVRQDLPERCAVVSLGLLPSQWRELRSRWAKLYGDRGEGSGRVAGSIGERIEGKELPACRLVQGPVAGESSGNRP